MPSPATYPGSSCKPEWDNAAEESTPAGVQQPGSGSGMHAGLSAYATGSTGRCSTPWSAASYQLPARSVPSFHEMQVSATLPNTGRDCGHASASSPMPLQHTEVIVTSRHAHAVSHQHVLPKYRCISPPQQPTLQHTFCFLQQLCRVLWQCMPGIVLGNGSEP